MKFISRQFIQEWDVIKPWYGVSYFDYCHNRIVLHPIPFNLFVALYQKIRTVLKVGFKLEKLYTGKEVEEIIKERMILRAEQNIPQSEQH